MFATEALSKPKSSSSLGSVLVVEDETIIREMVVMSLRDEGYEVLVAEDGYNALSITHKCTDTLDLIILDVMIPYINGLDLCRMIRHEGNGVPILMLSAKGNESDRVIGLEVGADDYLPKPFGMKELLARCNALVRRKNQNYQTQGSTLRFADITIFPQECRVTVRGEEVNLAPKEFRILELFMSHPRRVWSREQLLEKIWGADFVGDSKTVDVHIRWLREKLEADPSDPKYLVTVRGFGYRLG
ncbi:response regulator with CheY-like receiver domain and winged-helix DNA-binding domain [Synechococcus sp. PCC 7502]|uniref:response regulator transcription factor n=1 Tax=Synechococcus sp. PCC 7502 TaxID=1173263 RepID=UPI00029FE538|nr:response regulator transcription factor [Synechococcus sp. PCC 7502]AFY73488.1 response regulator with CheY-like receiver domain and winged-helix DNA-binding domain [Synechococcus sp. PCC 7502]